MAEKRRAQRSDVAHVVRVVEGVERIETARGGRPLVFRVSQVEIPSPPQIQLRKTWTFQAISRHSRGASIRHTIAIGILACRFAVSPPGIQTPPHPQVQPPPLIASTHEAKTAPLSA